MNYSNWIGVFYLFAIAYRQYSSSQNPFSECCTALKMPISFLWRVPGIMIIVISQVDCWASLNLLLPSLRKNVSVAMMLPLKHDLAVGTRLNIRNTCLWWCPSCEYLCTLPNSHVGFDLTISNECDGTQNNRTIRNSTSYWDFRYLQIIQCNEE